MFSTSFYKVMSRTAMRALASVSCVVPGLLRGEATHMALFVTLTITLLPPPPPARISLHLSEK